MSNKLVKLSLAACLGLLCLDWAFAQQSPVPLQLGLSVTRASVKLGEPIDLRATVTNTGKTAAHYLMWAREGYQIEIHDSKGNLVLPRGRLNAPSQASTTPIATRNPNEGSNVTYVGEDSISDSSMDIVVLPGKSIVEPILVVSGQDIPTPGVYTIKVSRLSSDKKSALVSSSITVTVTP